MKNYLKLAAAALALAAILVHAGHAQSPPAGVQISRSAVATQSRHDPAVTNTEHPSESKTLALMLAGLGLMGVITLRRMRR